MDHRLREGNFSENYNFINEVGERAEFLLLLKMFVVTIHVS